MKGDTLLLPPPVSLLVNKSVNTFVVPSFIYLKLEAILISYNLNEGDGS